MGGVVIGLRRFKVTVVVIVGMLAYAVFTNETRDGETRDGETREVSHSVKASTESIALAFESRRSDVQVRGEGIVQRVLSDDNKGRRHQRFILILEDGFTVLVAHNIDLAPRLSDLKVGDRVEFYGEYEWTARGGVLHWTHDDPRGRHVGGWLKHAGKIHQ